MELKYPNTEDNIQPTYRSNRTFMELKSQHDTLTPPVVGGSNRTFMELKSLQREAL